ncbi:MAG: Stp1/IreP family PP2C-type Ser/Thr phosphatase [Bdellovibrionales bacterium]
MRKTVSFGKTHIGLKRRENQDSIIIDKELDLYAVADGMGGHKGGAIASKLAIEQLQKVIKESLEDKNAQPETILSQAFQEANTQVYEKSQETIETEGMGTTLVAALVWKNKIFFANVGDSRAYLSRDLQLWRITEDHSILNNQIKKGLIDEKKASLLVDTNIITRSIGFTPNVEVDIFQKDLQDNDLFILCSDGLVEMMDDEKISHLSHSYSPDVLVDRLIDQSLEAGGNDNISVIVIIP